MAGVSPHHGDSKQLAAAMQLSPRLQSCWKTDIDWELIPQKLREVHVANKEKAVMVLHNYIFFSI